VLHLKVAPEESYLKLSTKQIIEYVGILSIVASLIFVGIQLRQETRIALAEVYSMRTEQRLANLRTLLESEIAILELVDYRQRSLMFPDYSIPEGWINEEDPRISEARRIRNELVIVSLDNVAYQSSLGLFSDLGPLRESLRKMFSYDPSFMEFALRGPTISEVTRSLFRDIATEIENN